MPNNLVCCSLRKRPLWAPLVPALLRESHGGWKEAKLDTHDAALPLPNPNGASQRTLRAILLSPIDVGADESRNRIQRLFYLNGGQDIAIVFLLEQTQGHESPMAALMTLELQLVGEFEMPIIPVDSVQAVPTCLERFQRQVCISKGSKRMESPARTLLPYCSDGPPLPDHAVNVLTDITSGIRDLLDVASTPAGQTKIAEFLGSDSEKIISFWAKEYLVE